jgi:hypothetical protein
MDDIHCRTVSDIVLNHSRDLTDVTVRRAGNTVQGSYFNPV